MTIGDLATTIYVNEFSGVSGAPSADKVSGWLNANIGQLNTLIHTCFDNSSGDIDLGNEEAAIFSELYLYNYYTKEAASVLRGVGVSAGSYSNVVSVREGDTIISLGNKNEIAKTLRGVAADKKSALDDMVAKYLIYQSTPIQVYGEE